MVIDQWDYCLREIYDTPASVSVIKGEWKTGKTDFALHLTIEELKQRLKLVSEVAGNIRCYEDAECNKPSNKDVYYIDNFQSLESWLFSPHRKAFIYDEALKSTPSKKAMTALNAYWLKIVPELSKGRCHLFVLTQEETMTEKLFLHPTFRMATWTKIALKKSNPQFRKMVRLSSKILKRKLTFVNIPGTQVHFNPYLSASWGMSITSFSLENLPLEFKVLIDYANGLSVDMIKKKYDEIGVKHRVEVTRLMRKGLKPLIQKLQVQEDMRREKPSPELQQIPE